MAAPGLTLIFTFFNEDNNPLNNNTMYLLRRLVAECFAVAGFGEILSSGDKVWNQNASPETDEYHTENNELYILYYWELPVTNGDLPILLGVEIPLLINRIRMNPNFERIGVIIRSNFS